MSLRAALVVALLGSIGWSMPVFAQCGGSQLCAQGADPCTVNADCTITVPNTGVLQIDLGNRKLVITKTLTVAGSAGASLIINAGSFLLDGGTIVAPGDDFGAGNVTINLNLGATVQNNGLIDVSHGIAPGSVDIEALGGDMNFAGRIRANASTRAGDGGFITLFGLGNLTASGTMDASAGDMGFGGEIDLFSQNGFMTVSNVLNAAGGDGGSLDLEAGTTLNLASSATMMVNANGDAGSGGDLELDSVGDMTVNADSDGTGSPAASSQDMQAGGDGADVTMTSDTGSLTLNGKIDASGAAGGGGGNIDLEAAVNLNYTKQLFAMSTGDGAFGGDVNLFAGGDLTMPQQVNTNGGTGSGGTMEATAGGTLTVSAPVITDGTQGGGATLLYGCNGGDHTVGCALRARSRRFVRGHQHRSGQHLDDDQRDAQGGRTEPAPVQDGAATDDRIEGRHPAGGDAPARAVAPVLRQLPDHRPRRRPPPAPPRHRRSRPRRRPPPPHPEPPPRPSRRSVVITW